MIIRISDGRAIGYCAAGQRHWFKKHGLDFKDFLRNGIDAEIVREIGDKVGLDLIAHMEKEGAV